MDERKIKHTGNIQEPDEWSLNFEVAQIVKITFSGHLCPNVKTINRSKSSPEWLYLILIPIPHVFTVSFTSTSDVHLCTSNDTNGHGDHLAKNTPILNTAGSTYSTNNSILYQGLRIWQTSFTSFKINQFGKQWSSQLCPFIFQRLISGCMDFCTGFIHTRVASLIWADSSVYDAGNTIHCSKGCFPLDENITFISELVL